MGENADIEGEYKLIGTHLGRPAYQKPGTSIAIRFWAPMSRWVIDRDGLRNVDFCVAYADSAMDSEDPCMLSAIWYVFESSRGEFLADANLRVSAAANAPSDLPRAQDALARVSGTYGPGMA